MLHFFIAHVNCANTYSFLFGRVTDRDASNLNCQSCEQRNKILNRLKRIASFANLDFFMLVIRLFMEMDNRRLIQNMEQIK